MSAMRKLLIWLPLALIAVILVTFIVANRHAVDLVLLPGATALSVPLYLVFFLGIFAGLALAALFQIVSRLRSGFRERRHQREVNTLKAQVSELEEAMVADSDGTPPTAISAQTALAKD